MFKKKTAAAVLITAATLALALTGCASSTKSSAGAPSATPTAGSSSSAFPDGSSSPVKVPLGSDWKGLSMSVARDDNLVASGGAKFKQAGLVLRITNSTTGSLALEDGMSFGQDVSDSANTMSGEPMPTHIPSVCAANEANPANELFFASQGDPTANNELIVNAGQSVFGCTVLDSRTVGKTVTLNLNGWNTNTDTSYQKETVQIPTGDLFAK